MISDHDIERIAEAVCRRLDRRETAREDARYLAGLSIDDLIEHQREKFRRAKRESQLEAKTETLGHSRRG